MRPKSTKEDFKDLPIERLMELCAFYDCQAQNYYSKWMKCNHQLDLAEIILSKEGYKPVPSENDQFYDYCK